MANVVLIEARDGLGLAAASQTGSSLWRAWTGTRTARGLVSGGGLDLIVWDVERGAPVFSMDGFWGGPRRGARTVRRSCTSP